MRLWRMRIFELERMEWKGHGAILNDRGESYETVKGREVK